MLYLAYYYFSQDEIIFKRNKGGYCRMEQKQLKNKNGNVEKEKIILRQGERIVFLENMVKQLEDQLVKERADRIEDLKTINFIATSNSYNNTKVSLRKIAEMTRDELKNITNGIINLKLKELNSRTNQSI